MERCSAACPQEAIDAEAMKIGLDSGSDEIDLAIGVVRAPAHLDPGDLAAQVRETSGGQFPFAAILGYASPEECRARHVLDFDAAPDEAPSLASRVAVMGQEPSPWRWKR